MAQEQQEQQESPLHLAEILSDLVSLRVCDPSAALALVSARPNTPTHTETQKNAEEDDVELGRAKELLKLHYDVKERHKRGDLARGLEEARREVGRVVGG
ncbi:hypothetical protein HBH43_115080 [Parastagonospora nodorum]|nr:hypothetical protein HBH43_115080 [Parastagonospora nodorum]KAH5636254.1 hypothetical protein HBI51_164470 [Parastagonospora nodorum]